MPAHVIVWRVVTSFALPPFVGFCVIDLLALRVRPFASLPVDLARFQFKLCVTATHPCSDTCTTPGMEFPHIQECHHRREPRIWEPPIRFTIGFVADRGRAILVILAKVEEAVQSPPLQAWHFRVLWDMSARHTAICNAMCNKHQQTVKINMLHVALVEKLKFEYLHDTKVRYSRYWYSYLFVLAECMFYLRWKKEEERKLCFDTSKAASHGFPSWYATWAASGARSMKHFLPLQQGRFA